MLLEHRVLLCCLILQRCVIWEFHSSRFVFFFLSFVQKMETKTYCSVQSIGFLSVFNFMFKHNFHFRFTFRSKNKNGVLMEYFLLLFRFGGKSASHHTYYTPLEIV